MEDIFKIMFKQYCEQNYGSRNQPFNEYAHISIVFYGH